MSDPGFHISTYPANSTAYLRGLIGAVIGGVAGFFFCWWLYKQGLYALAIPGAFLGLGCGTLSRVKSWPLCIFCAITGFALSVFMEWYIRPFNDDNSLSYFLKNLNNLDSQATWLFIVLGTGFAAWFGLGRSRMMLEKS